jgi:glycosyltransferase involved in cell wall biosynthesis
MLNKKNKRIIMKSTYLVLTPFFPTEDSFRGPYIFDQVEAIERSGDYDVIVIKFISFYQKKSVKEYVYQGVRVYNFKVLDAPSFVLPGLFKFINLYRLERYIKNIINIDLSKVEIIHAHGAYPTGALAVDLGKRFSIKSFVQHHGLGVMQLGNGKLLKGKLKKLNNKFIKNRFLKTVNNATLNIGVSHKVIKELKKVEGFSSPHTYVLHNGVNVTKFYKKNTPKKTSDFTIGCIGNFWTLKDQMLLLKALDILIKNGKNLRVQFIGSGATLQSCKEYVIKQKLENYVKFLSEVDHTQLNSFYNNLDIFVLPSYYEAFGCVYAEALQIGIPIIAVRGQGIEDIIKTEDKERFLIDKGSYQELAIKIISMMEQAVEIKYDMDIDKKIRVFLNDMKLNFKDLDV